MKFIYPHTQINTKILYREVKYIIIVALQKKKSITCLSLCENLYWPGEILSVCEVFQALYDSCDPAMAETLTPSTLGKLLNLRV